MLVSIRGMPRVVPYIARIDSLEDNELEEVFLKKIQRCSNFDKLTVVIDDVNQDLFIKTDIVCNLPEPHIMRESARKSQQLFFNAICVPTVCKNFA